MEKVNEGFLLGNYHLDFDDAEKKILIKALMSYLQFCCYFSYLSRLYRDVSLCKALLSKLGVTDIESLDLKFKL